MVDRIHPNVLIVSDEAAASRLLLEVLANKGIRGIVVRDLPSAARQVQQRSWQLVIANLPGIGPEATGFLRQVKDADPELPVVILSAAASVESAVRAVREGCHDVLVHPVTPQRIQALLETLLPNHDVPLAAADQQDTRCLYQIAGRSPGFLETIRLARRVAPTSVPVLIVGETGTGKELLSYLIHRQSSRSAGPYIRVNCAAVSESLLESELFGHERGAFTGAYAQRKGRLERAHGGTLLLDEISETGPRLQAELLRVLETQDFERVGGSESLRVNVRVVSTTNRDLHGQVQRGRFRPDLFYRIGGVHLAVPPLRERKEDIPVLVWHFVNQYAREVRRRITDLDGPMLDLFEQYPWPGNVRQLRSVVRTALILGEGPVLSLDGAPSLRLELQCPPGPAGMPLSLREVERQAIVEALRRTGSHYTQAARLLGITDRTLREKLRRYRRDGCLERTGEEQWATELA